MCVFYTLNDCLMKKNILLLVCCVIAWPIFAQRLLSWTPEFPTDASNITFTVDAAKGNQGLYNYEAGNSQNVYVHVGVLTNLSTGPSDWKYVKFVYGSADPLAKATPLGSNKYSYTINNIRSFFGVPATETIRTVNVIFRDASGNLKAVNSDGSDMYIPVYGASQFAVRLNLPPFEPRYVPWLEPITATVGSTLTIAGVSSANAALDVSLNGTSVGTIANNNSITVTPTLTTSCEQKVILTGNNGTVISKDSFSFFINPVTNVAALPTGVQEGINYAADNKSATLVLFAPGKTNVTVIGDFSGWQTLCANQMNKTTDGNYFWITISNLTPGTEYGYQYLVDNAIKIADPYAQKILDPNNDQYINATTYPNLKPYPTGLTTGMVSVMQPAEPQYTWQSTSYTKPDKKNLMIYELLVRDFTAQHSYQALIDSFQYFKNLGINAIELMPINEFTGNESWGYNPTFYFAPDKYYGTKNKLKEFIDKCHLNNIAVILDVVYNHCDNEAPEAKLYWDAANSRPAANNPWLNVTAPHPYSVFNDFNHNSIATQYLVQRSLNHWLDEYKVDGFRFDLAKGFTQTQTTTTTVENYDASRVANLERYYNGTIANHPDAYMILEFLGTLPCQEEQEYATHGFMLWGNNNVIYNQLTMGYSDNSDISPIVYNSAKKGYSNPAEVGYMESHDEERTMFKNHAFGNSNGSYNVKNLATALRQEEAASSVFFTVPGPKMIWQFEERGYDTSIVYGGSNTANKPPHWEYMQDPNRKHLYDTYNSIIQFRLNNASVFNSTSFTYDFASGNLFKIFQIADPAAAGKKVTVVANLDVTAQTKQITFQNAGDWTNYISNGTGTGINGVTGNNFTLTSATQSITLQPGEYHIFVTVPACTTAIPTVTSPVNYCLNGVSGPLTATGTGLLWYTTATGGTGSATAPTPVTTTAGTTTYYVSQTVNCESARTPIVVNVVALPAAPVVSTPVSFCLNSTATSLTATGTNLLWYTAATGGTGSVTAPTPVTTTVGTTTYYVSQTPASCESPRTAIVVNITAGTAAPTTSSPVNYCQNTASVPLTATGTSLLWYTAATGGTGSATAPTPSTATVGSMDYFVTQTQSCGESPRAKITVAVTALPAAPTATSPIAYCQNTTSVALTATGTGLLWYTTATGGTGSATAPIPPTATAGSTIYYVSQTPASCESPRTAITVNITAAPNAPSVTSAVNYCQDVASTALTATGTNLLWYTIATGGIGSATAPTPSTATAGSVIYYVSQTPATCESPRAAITVTVTSKPTAPTVTSPVNYCLGNAAITLSATGNGLLWYTTATGGTGSSTAPTPSTASAGAITYYVTQSNGCGESVRAAVVVNVNAAPAPTNLTASNITTSSATLSWGTVTGLFYTVEYKASSSSSWTAVLTNSTLSTYILTDLQLGISYDWRVSANCTSANSLNYVTSQFTTLSRNTNIADLKDGFGIKISPNPVGSSAIIDYIVPGSGTVSLVVLDVTGRVVKQLWNLQQSAGQYQYEIKGQLNNIMPGIYFIRLRQNGKGNFTSFFKN
jgi:1,4-alpha-glucan branching enzyme